MPRPLPPLDPAAPRRDRDTTPEQAEVVERIRGARTIRHRAATTRSLAQFVVHYRNGADTRED